MNALEKLRAMRATQNNVVAANDDYSHKVICYTPNGQPLAVIARNAEHAAYLVAVNPKPTPESIKALLFENDFSEFEDVVIVKICHECDFFQPDKINPPQGLGRCELEINRKNKPLYPMQDACDQAKPLTPF